MNKRHLLTALALGWAMTMLAGGSGRQVHLLNFGWRFHAGDVKNAEQIGFDDAAWRSVDLPHDYQIEQPWVAPDESEKADNNDPAANIRSRLSSRGFKEMGKGWYRYHLTPGDELKGRRLLLDFGGIMYVGDVYLNGQRIGGTDYGYVGFQIDVTDKVQFGRDNVIAVMADTRDPMNSRWYTGGGLIRDVRLISVDKTLSFARHPLYITTRDNKFVNISVSFHNRSRERDPRMTLTILAPDGQTVCHDTIRARRIAPKLTTEVKLPEVAIAAPQLWDTDHPNLYTAQVQLLLADGTVADEYSEHFGIRTVEFSPDYGMKLNGRKVLLKGYANHHSLGALGAAAYPRAIEKRIQLMKEYGINHIRTSHNPYSREFIELCDKYGILVVDELYDKWTRQHTGGRVAFEELWQKDVPEWVTRDRNSPSVILWSLGNELQQDPHQPFDDFGVTMYRLMRTLIARYDSTRLTTVAMHPRYRNWETDSLPCDLAMATDIQSYNYRYMYFPGDGRRFPWMRFYQSEASVAAMGENYFSMDLDKVIGLAYWGAIDYLGESQGWPSKGWSQGVFDISLEPKPKAYLMKSLFCPDAPLVHIGIIDKKGDMPWNGVQTGNDSMSDHWNRKAGTTFSLYTYTNADEVELLLNGRSLGIKQNPTDPRKRNQIKWDDVAYEPGKLEAIARKGGQVVARHKIETTGEPAKLIIEADKPTTWQADGMDLQHVRITVLDKKGRMVQTARGEVTFSVSGDARIVGVTNGNIISMESYADTKRQLYNGTCGAIVRAGRKAGPVVITATAPGMKPVTLKLATH